MSLLIKNQDQVIELPPLPTKPLKRNLSDLILDLKRPKLQSDELKDPIQTVSGLLIPRPIQTLVRPVSVIALKDDTKKKALVAPQTPSVSVQEVCSDNGKRKWAISKMLGKGGCGVVFLARELDKDPNNLEKNPFVALKMIKDKKQFQVELRTMKLLNDHVLGRGNTPKLICACRKSKALVMEYLSETVAHQFEKLSNKFSLKTCLMLAINMLEISRQFYLRTGQVHVDMKPSNFCIGKDGKELQLIDFGYSTAPNTKLPGQTGTPLFMSWSIQAIGNTYPSWLDDLESIGYVLMFFMAGGKRGLPWGHLRDHRDISLCKNDVSIRDFCSRLKGTEYEPMAEALYYYLYVTRDRTRSFLVEEDYRFLIGLFQKVMLDQGYTNDKMYDWVTQVKN